MQTFLPYSSFTKSAQVLDCRRLGKQRVEVLQILGAITGESGGWTKHPATKMWWNYKGALALYGIAICLEWRERGYRGTCLEKICAYCFDSVGVPQGTICPAWLGDPAFHAAHRAALLAKDFEHYSQFGWTEEPAINYIWPKGADL